MPRFHVREAPSEFQRRSMNCSEVCCEQSALHLPSRHSPINSLRTRESTTSLSLDLFTYLRPATKLPTSVYCDTRHKNYGSQHDASTFPNRIEGSLPVRCRQEHHHIRKQESKEEGNAN